MPLKYEELTEQIIGAAFEVFNHLGYRFLEKVYQRAMQVKLKLRNIESELEKLVKVNFKGYIVGDYAADLLVEDKVLVELKVATNYNPKDEPQLLNELNATDHKVGLLINFAKKKVEFKRFIY
ncbi:MAG: GxxExxY protein [Verrucomicrobia bacterium]|nr:GxxExxY protein [Verrucomicrobiota bacterium]